MVNTTTLSAVKYKHRNDGQGLSNAQTFHGFLLSRENARGGKKVKERKSIYKQKQRPEGKQSSDMINDQIFYRVMTDSWTCDSLKDPRVGSPNECERKRPHILSAAFASVRKIKSNEVQSLYTDKYENKNAVICVCFAAYV